MSTFAPTSIDTDHWRRLYMLIGIVWGCGVLEVRHQHRLARGEIST
jgi:hypothetical protein